MIHPFPNGNGRHARLFTDQLLMAMGERVFAWSGTNLTAAGDIRSSYIAALRKADSENDFADLVAFARS